MGRVSTWWRSSRSTVAESDMSLFSGLGTDVHFTGEEAGILQWEGSLFEPQTAVEWKAVVSRGADERTQMNSMAILLATCKSLTNRDLVVQGMVWVAQGTDPQQRETSGWCESPLQCAGSDDLRSCEGACEAGCVADRNGMAALGKIRERSGKTAGVQRNSLMSSSSSGLPTRIWRVRG